MISTIKRLLRRFRWPLCWRSTLDLEVLSLRKAMGEQEESLRREMQFQQNKFERLERQRHEMHEAELAVTKMAVDGIVRKLSNVEFQRLVSGMSRPTYRLVMEVDPLLIDYGSMINTDKRIVADCLARQVTAEFMSSRFVSPAKQEYRPPRYFDRKNAPGPNEKLQSDG